MVDNLLDRIKTDPSIKGNKPCIKGTRIPVEIILDSLASGDSIKELADRGQLEKADIIACIKFARKLVNLHWKNFLADKSVLAMNERDNIED